jgi:hypothetical protein
MGPEAKQKALKSKLLRLGYPWPENLEGKSTWWLETEIGVLTPKRIFGAKAKLSHENSQPTSESDRLEVAADHAIAFCGGNVRNAVKALIAVFESLRQPTN